jgi:hypothetical protein
MISQIPLIAVASQTMAVQLGGQLCRIDVFQKATGLYMDLYVADVPVVLGVICEDRNPLVRSIYLGFLGDLYFWDSQGAADPDYTGLGGRFLLLWDSTLGNQSA